MQKARIILSTVAIFALVGSGLAFKAARFTGLPIWHPTTYISTLVNGRVYATYAPNLYTQSGATLFSTTALIALLHKTAGVLPPTTVQGTATDGSGYTTAITTFPVTTTRTRVVTFN
jgi:hypothetical protein